VLVQGREVVAVAELEVVDQAANKKRVTNATPPSYTN